MTRRIEGHWKLPEATVADRDGTAQPNGLDRRFQPADE
jgi:hypothetical protein